MNPYPKKAFKTLIGMAALYTVFFTFVGPVIVETILIGAYTLVHWNVPKEDRPQYRYYILEQPIFRAICDASNWVADITLPLVSDEVMIAHWQKHHELWEAAIDQIPINSQPEAYSRYEAYVRSIGLANIDYTRPSKPDPDRFATMIPPPELGASSRIRPCVAMGASNKSYEYIPETPLKVVGNLLVRPSALEFSKKSGTSPHGTLLVESTDNAHYVWSMRRLSPHWYIIRSD